MLTQYEAHAQRIAWRWENPGDRPRTQPPTCTLEYLAEKGFWHAQNIDGFRGDLEAWYTLVRSYLQISTPQPASGRKASPPPSALTPASVSPQKEAVSGPPLAAANPYFEEL